MYVYATAFTGDVYRENISFMSMHVSGSALFGYGVYADLAAFDILLFCFFIFVMKYLHCLNSLFFLFVDNIAQVS